MLEAAKERLNGILQRLDVQSHLTVIAAHDPATHLHLLSVAQLCAAFAARLGEDDAMIERIATAGLFHDIGKLYVPNWVLSAPRELNRKEWTMIYTHPELGASHMRRAGEHIIADIIVQHHERLDGSGYPAGVRGRKISYEAQVVSIVDFFDATRYRRAYRPLRHTTADVIELLYDRAGTQFDPELIDIACTMFREDDGDQTDTHSHALRA